MTIKSGSLIESLELNYSEIVYAIGYMQGFEQIHTKVYWYNVTFENVKVNSSQGEKNRLFISPDNYILDEIRITTKNVRAPLTASVSSAYMLRPVQISSSGDATGSMTKLVPYFGLTGSTPYQTILRGNEYQITFNTSMTGSVRNSAVVSLGFRTSRRRE